MKSRFSFKKTIGQINNDASCFASFFPVSLFSVNQLSFFRSVTLVKWNLTSCKKKFFKFFAKSTRFILQSKVANLSKPICKINKIIFKHFTRACLSTNMPIGWFFVRKQSVDRVPLWAHIKQFLQKWSDWLNASCYQSIAFTAQPNWFFSVV